MRVKRTRILVNARCDQTRSTEEPAVQIEVTDTGTGIPADLIACVFERGFTTKRPGHGSGLGLGICRDIIHMHGGRMELVTGVGAPSPRRVAGLRRIFRAIGTACFERFSSRTPASTNPVRSTPVSRRHVWRCEPASATAPN
jgi:signal transduction histidine kinase